MLHLTSHSPHTEYAADAAQDRPSGSAALKPATPSVPPSPKSEPHTALGNYAIVVHPPQNSALPKPLQIGSSFYPRTLEDLQLGSFLDAVNAGDHTAVQGHLAANPALLRMQDSVHRSAIHYAINPDRESVLNELLKPEHVANLPVNASDKYGDTPLQLAIIKKNAQAVSSLLSLPQVRKHAIETRSPLNGKYMPYGRAGMASNRALFGSVLHQALICGDPKIVKAVLDQVGRSVVNTHNRERRTPLADTIHRTMCSLKRQSTPTIALAFLKDLPFVGFVTNVNQLLDHNTAFSSGPYAPDNLRWITKRLKLVRAGLVEQRRPPRVTSEVTNMIVKNKQLETRLLKLLEQRNSEAVSAQTGN